MSDHWNQHARQWHHVGPPLRPAREDIDIAERAVRDWCDAFSIGNALKTFNALLLGVTPEIALMEWQAGARLIAVDRSQAMIDAMWQKPALPAAWQAQLGEWNALSLGNASQHIVIGDGCFVLLTYPEPWQSVACEVRRVLHEAGIFIIRFFVRPEAQETTAQVFADLRAGRIGNFHVFKWRLAMALHGSVEEGVCLNDIWQAWHDDVVDRQSLARQLGWSIESMRTIDVYRNVQTHYTFPTLTEVRNALAPYFEETACVVPEYELGACCPTLILKPK